MPGAGLTLPARRAGAQGKRAARSHPRRRPHQSAPIAQAFRLPPGGGAPRRRDRCRRWIGQASARTCKTISNSPSRWASKQPITLLSPYRPVGRSFDRRRVAPTGRASAPQIISRPAASSARARASATPDIQFHFLPLAVAYDGSTLAREHGFQAHVGPMRSKSRGWVRLRSQIRPNRPRSSSMTSAIPRTGSRCAPAYA